MAILEQDSSNPIQKQGVQGHLNQNLTSNHQIAEWLAVEYNGVSLYVVAMLFLVIAMIWTGAKVVKQIQDYRHQYSHLQFLKREHRQLQIEYQRLLIEQQTFSGTPQIASRAVSQLNMYYPRLSDRMIIQSANSQIKNDQPIPYHGERHE